jgi:hypothetical protein
MWPTGFCQLRKRVSRACSWETLPRKSLTFQARREKQNDEES